MSIDGDRARAYLLSKPEALEDFPFGPDAAVFKIRGKLFAILSYVDGVAHINLKCDPQQALILRDVYAAVIPGYHMNKRHWNTVILNATIPDAEIKTMIDHSYALVVKGMKKATRTSLELMHGRDEIYK